MEELVDNSTFWRGKKVLVTGHTGFKGGWLCLYLKLLGANVYGYALENVDRSAIYNAAKVNKVLSSEKFGDIRDRQMLEDYIKGINPQVVFHLAAQPLVRASYLDPIDTYSTNVIGLVNVFEACKNCASIETIINVTSDKCYENLNWCWPYRETDNLGGHDPYSASKACSEIISKSYYKSFFADSGVGLSSARAGNVIGGGDQAEDRLIPDFYRAKKNGTELVIRYPNATRPWQHVMEPISGYVELAKRVNLDREKFNGAWNFGPSVNEVCSVYSLLQHFCKLANYDDIVFDQSPSPHEAAMLSLDSSKSNQLLHWKSKWNIENAVRETHDWYMALEGKKDLFSFSMSQVEKYVSLG